MPVLILIAVYATGAELFNIYLNASQLSPKMFIGNLLMIAGAVIFALTRHKYTHITPSYEENMGEEEQAGKQ